MQIRSDRRYDFAADRPEVWAALLDVGSYQRWWPWLKGFEANGLVVGDAWDCLIQPPLPYTLRFVIRLDDVVEGSSVQATVRGDVVGAASIDLYDTMPGCQIHLRSRLGPGHRALQAIAVVARPLVQRSHDWVLDTGARQFGRGAL